MRSREKLAGDWSFGDDVSGILSVLISNRCSFYIFWQKQFKGYIHVYMQFDRDRMG